MKYYPEGANRALAKTFNSISDITTAVKSGEIFEGRVILCDKQHNLHINLGAAMGIIPRTEGAYGVLEGTVRDIALISKVGKYVCFRVKGLHRDENGQYVAILSRRAVQIACLNDYVSQLKCGDIIDARVTHLERFGAFIDIGAGINSLIPIDMLSVSRISHSAQRLCDGEMIKTVLKSREGDKLTFSLKELLGTWQQNADHFCAGETVTGTVRSIESYGIFVELLPNLAGLAELCDDIRVGQGVSVFIKSIIPEKMKIKLVIVEAFEDRAKTKEPVYFTDSNHIDHWLYSPPVAEKLIETDFT